MSLTLYFHPLSSFCHKALIALYENATPFTPHSVDLGDEKSTAPLKALWPIGTFPVLHDEARRVTAPEATIIIEYLAQHYPGPVALIPADPDRARETRLKDRFFDNYIHVLMQKCMGDRLRPKGKEDPVGVEDAKARIRVALGMLERNMETSTWAMGEEFGMADCAAAPSLFYTGMVIPLAATYPNTAAYLDRLKARPSYARALKEAEPYFELIPKARSA